MEQIRSFFIKIVLLINKFQNLLLFIFVFGLIDYIAYMDAIVISMANPEIGAVVLISLFLIGLFRWRKHKKKKKADAAG